MPKAEQKKSNFKILVIDDSNLSTNTISSILNSSGYTAVEQANSPVDGLARSNSENFHLYIIDVVMPKISGIDLSREISNNTNSCILVMSSLDSENILIEAIASGAKDFLVKPFTADQLLTSVDKLYEFAIKEKIF